MAKLTRKILGNVNGAVGDITFADWKGRTVIKAKIESNNSEPTEAQLLVREKFQLMTELATAFSKVIPTGLDGSADDITSYNLFRRLNTPAISGGIGTLVVDNTAIAVSRGKLETLNTLALSSAAKTVSATWDYGNYGNAGDKVNLVVYNPTRKETALGNASMRTAGTCSVTVPIFWATHQVYVYIFTSSGTAASVTQYLGTATIS